MEEEEIYDEEGLNTKLRPKSKSAMKGSEQVESFLKQVERELLSIGWDTEMPEKKEKDLELKRLLQTLEKSDIVFVPTDKTNKYESMEKDEYKNLVKEHLKQSAREIERGRVVEICEDAKVLVDAIGFKLSKNEVGHINESLKTKAIPPPKLLIKDHKKMSNMVKVPTRLVIPATNFSANFAKIGYLGVKNILEKM